MNTISISASQKEVRTGLDCFGKPDQS